MNDNQPRTTIRQVLSDSLNYNADLQSSSDVISTYAPARKAILAYPDGNARYRPRCLSYIVSATTTDATSKQVPITLHKFFERCDLDFEWRMKLAATAAKCFLSTAGGDWLQLTKWDGSGDSFYVLGVKTRGLQDSLYVLKDLKPADYRFAPSAYSREQVETMLLVLGIFLLELVHGKPFSQCPWINDDSDREAIRCGAKLWTQDNFTWDLIRSKKITNAILKCISANFKELPFGKKELQWEYKFRIEFLTSVVDVFERAIACDREPTRHGPQIMRPEAARQVRLRNADEPAEGVSSARMAYIEGTGAQARNRRA